MSSSATTKEETPTTTSTTAATVQVLKPYPISIPTTICRSYTILNIHTDIFVQLFSDRIFVGITQLNCKIGTYVLCQASISQIDHATIDYNISTVLGNHNDAMPGVYARRITDKLLQQRILTKDPMCLFLGISLKDGGKDPTMFAHIVDIVVNLIQEALVITSN